MSKRPVSCWPPSRSESSASASAAHYYTRRVPRLIVLNGPPGIGKSTIAQMYVDEHPGVLNLDIDRLTELIGGWRTQRKRIVALGRTAALAMGATHLRSGSDVIVPQLVGRLPELERFEAVARDARAAFCHIVLMDGKTRSAERFVRRGHDTEDPWLRELHAHVDRLGRDELLSQIYEDLSDVVRSRLTSILVTSEEDAIQRTYDVVAAALAHDIPPTPPRGVAVVLDGERVLVIKRRRKGLEYAVLPGGGVEAGESAADATLRELHEETSLTARIGSLLWHRSDDAREATYFLMSYVRGAPMLSGDEAREHSLDNSFVLTWSTAEELDTLKLQPKAIRPLLTALMRSPVTRTAHR